MPGQNVQTTSVSDAVPPEPARAPFPLVAMELDLVTLPELVEPEWRELEALPLNSLNQGYDWCSAWWAAHHLSPAVLRGRAMGRTVMLLPLESVTRYGLRTLRLPGERFNNLNTGLFSADFPLLEGSDLTRFVSDITRSLAPLADILLLDCMSGQRKGAENPFSRLAASENPNPSFQLPLRPTMEETIAQLNAKTRRKRFRSQCRRLEALGGFEHYVPEGADEQHMLLDLFFRQKAERFEAFGLPDVFQPPEIRQFFHDLVDRPNISGDYVLKMHGLRLKGAHEGHIIATSALSRKGGHVLCQFSSIDDKLCPDASPGELLFWLMIEQSCQEGASVFDFGVGDQPYKHSWCTETTVTKDIVLPLTSRGRLAMPVLRGLTRLRQAVKRNPKLYAAVQRIRTMRR